MAQTLSAQPAHSNTKAQLKADVRELLFFLRANMQSFTFEDERVINTAVLHNIHFSHLLS